MHLIANSQKTHCVSITKTNRLKLSRIKFTVYSEHIINLRGREGGGEVLNFLNVKSGGTNSYHCDLNG